MSVLRRGVRLEIVALGLGAASTVAIAWLSPMASGWLGLRPMRVASGAAIRGDVLVEVSESSRALVRFRGWALRDLTQKGPMSELARRHAARVRAIGGHAANTESAKQGGELLRSMGKQVPEVPAVAPCDDVAARGPMANVAPSELGEWGVFLGELEAGWPFRSLWMYSVLRHEMATDPLTGQPAAKSTTEWSGCWHLYSSRRDGPDSTAGRFPLLPLWSGFVADTVLFSAIWFVFLVAPGALRRTRRRRRGRCPRCGYDLRHDLAAGCPECGWNRITPRPGD